MKKNLFKRGMAGLLSLVMCLTALVGIGTTTAYAAGERAEVYLVSFPRSGDANIDYSGTWGHPNLRYMNGWHSGESKYTTIRAMHSYDGNICYCIEPGVQQDTGDTYTSKDETFWDNLPSDINSTISPYDIKLFIGRIMQYGYTGPISTSWRSQNPADAATLAEAMATQVLICNCCKVITNKPKKYAPDCPAKSVRRRSPKSDMRVKSVLPPYQACSGFPGLQFPATLS